MNALTSPAIVKGNMSKAIDDSSAGNTSMADRLTISLINIEEDQLSRIQENYVRTDACTLFRNPPIRLNLYILMAANKADHGRSLAMLGLVMQYFQQNTVVNKASHPTLDDGIETSDRTLFIKF
jgi:ABC-type enterochelin transport system permease subunit